MTLKDLVEKLKALELANSDKTVVFPVDGLGWVEVDCVKIEEVKGSVVVLIDGEKLF